MFLGKHWKHYLVENRNNMKDPPQCHVEQKVLKNDPCGDADFMTFEIKWIPVTLQ